MLEAALDFERMARQLDPIVLVGTGSGCVIVGLLVWLGGWDRKSILAAVIGAAGGGALGFSIVGRNPMLLAGAAIAGCITAVITGKIFTMIVGRGTLLARLASTLCSSAAGTSLIFAGMILLLLYKGTVPITYISRNGSFYTFIFAAMTTFGTVEQLLLCEPGEKPPTRKRKENRNKQEAAPKTSGWRTT